VDIIAGASLARRRVNLHLSIVKTGAGYRAGLSSPDSGSVSKKCCLLRWDRGFESVFLQRRVSCEPDFLDQGTDRASCDRPAPEVAVTGAPREGGGCGRCAFSSA